MTKPKATDRVKGIEGEIEATRAKIASLAKKIEKMDAKLIDILAKPHTEEDVEAIEEAREDLRAKQGVLAQRIDALQAALPGARRGVDLEALSLAREAYPAQLEKSNGMIMRWRALVGQLADIAEAAKAVRESAWSLQELHDKIRFYEALTDSPREELTPAESLTEKELDAARASFESALHVRRFDAVRQLAEGAEQPAAVDLEPAGGTHQPELDREPEEPRHRLQHAVESADTLRLIVDVGRHLSRGPRHLAESHQHVREAPIGVHRHVARSLDHDLNVVLPRDLRQLAEGLELTDDTLLRRIEIAGLEDEQGNVIHLPQTSLEVAEAWWEFNPFGYEPVTFTVGKLDPTVYWDANVVANDETTQFLADIFVNSVAVEWPDYTPGFRLGITPNDLVDINLGILSADNDWEDLFEDVFAISEINFMPKFGKLEGNYRLYAWVNGIDHVEWDDVHLGRTEGDKNNYGFGLSFDQQCTRDITLFSRFGLQDDDIAGESYEAGDELEAFAMGYSWSLGGQITGERWNRPNDVFAIAIGQAILSDDYEDRLKADGIDPEDESHLELYYSLFLNDYVVITPDFQLIDNMGGDDDADTVYVFGIRCQLSF